MNECMGQCIGSGWTELGPAGFIGDEQVKTQGLGQAVLGGTAGGGGFFPLVSPRVVVAAFIPLRLDQ